LETELALVTQAAKLVEEGVRPTATYPVIAALASQGFSAKRCCRILRQEGKCGSRSEHLLRGRPRSVASQATELHKCNWHHSI
jgi:hypothetical protein